MIFARMKWEERLIPVPEQDHIAFARYEDSVESNAIARIRFAFVASDNETKRGG
jgi:hypothetical protein